MRRFTWWCAIFLLCATIVHLGYVLFIPRFQMSQIMKDVAAVAPVNSLVVLSAGQQAALFPGDSGAELRAVCPFDIATGHLVLVGAMPDTPWVIAVYSTRGELVYSLNSRQAGRGDVTLAVRPAKGLGSLVTPRENEAIINDGWTLEAPGRGGLAVIWAALGNPLDRPQFQARLKASSCRISTP